MEAFAEDLLKYIEEDQIGYTHSLPGPYGRRRSEIKPVVKMLIYYPVY